MQSAWTSKAELLFFILGVSIVWFQKACVSLRSRQLVLAGNLNWFLRSFEREKLVTQLQVALMNHFSARCNLVMRTLSALLRLASVKILRLSQYFAESVLLIRMPWSLQRWLYLLSKLIVPHIGDLVLAIVFAKLRKVLIVLTLGIAKVRHLYFLAVTGKSLFVLLAVKLLFFLIPDLVSFYSGNSSCILFCTEVFL